MANGYFVRGCRHITLPKHARLPRVDELSDGSEANCHVSSPRRTDAERLIGRRTASESRPLFPGESSSAWRLQLVEIPKVQTKEDLKTAADPFGIIIKTPSGTKQLEFEIERFL